ncbi:hypothetical protein [uncultured Sulfitobacter sp.]|uniref:hypothetical protein n=1 Tax=uncultured Sulfitobacter sp. TaxID=191468 RepID=UPI0030F5007F
MRLHLKRHVEFVAAIMALATTLLPGHAKAQSYPIDCAILLCLSGGWPTSLPCARARAEFIRRITPWPVEPPLQIWRCPMGASLDHFGGNTGPLIFDIRYILDREQRLQSTPRKMPEGNLQPSPLTRRSGLPQISVFDVAAKLHPVRDQADIDISGRDFDFVRSIRVFHVPYASQYQAGSEGNCERAAQVLFGSYGTQGEFSWQGSSTDELPEAHQGLEKWGQDCQRIDHRSVFVDWRDFDGNYGFEQVNY